VKIVKFRDYLVPLVLSGEKDSTWRLFDDKDLSVGDEIELRVFVTLQPFGQATIIEVIEKPMGELTAEDKVGHETYASDEEMYATYSGYYKQPVTAETPVKVIRFKLHKN
jgi:hypothetical protein